MIDISAYLGLFLAAFLAATIVPAQSEAVLIGLVSTNEYSVALLIVVASVGNVLGSIANWALGRGIQHYKDRKWFPVSESALARAQARYARYGRWSLLLSWIPFIGDPITIAAGIMRERFVPFVILVSIAKIGRYIVLVLLFQKALL